MTQTDGLRRTGATRRTVIGMSIVLVAAAGFASLAHAGGEHLPVYEPGQTFIFSNKRVERFVGADSDGLIWASRSGREYRRSANFVVPNLEWESEEIVLRRFPAGDPDGLWPLSRKSDARFSVTTEIRYKDKKKHKRRLRHWTCRVQGEETVQVRAGRFETLPIVCDLYSTNTMRPLQRRTWHYAPAVGHFVKRSKRNLRTGRIKSYELLAVLPPEQANKRRIRAILKDAE